MPTAPGENSRADSPPRGCPPCRSRSGLLRTVACLAEAGSRLASALLAACGLFVLSGAGRLAAADVVVWRLDNLQRIGEAAVQIWGHPGVDDGAMVFDGKRDGILLDDNPLSDCREFTVEILLCPAPGGGAAQRFFHVQDGQGEGMRVLVETRLNDEGGWWLDTFLRTDRDQRTLIDPARVHPTGQWHWVALRYDGKTMAHFVNGAQEAEGPVAFGPMAGGRVSLGVRQNQVYWFKGAIREVRFTPRAVAAGELQRVK